MDGGLLYQLKPLSDARLTAREQYGVFTGPNSRPLPGSGMRSRPLSEYPQEEEKVQRESMAHGEVIDSGATVFERVYTLLYLSAHLVWVVL